MKACGFVIIDGNFKPFFTIPISNSYIKRLIVPAISVANLAEPNSKLIHFVRVVLCLSQGLEKSYDR